MKTLPLILSCFALSNPICDYKVGKLFESDRYSNISICYEGDLFLEDIQIIVKSGSDELIIEPQANIGYNPSIFVANFLNNGLEQVLYSVDSGGSGGYSYYELYSFKSGEGELIFNSSEFNPHIEASYYGDDQIKIDYQGKALYLDASKSSCNVEDCSLYISEVNSVFPYYNFERDRYYLQVLQRVYGGFSANNLGYISSLVEVNEDGYNIIDVGILSNFAEK